MLAENCFNKLTIMFFYNNCKEKSNDVVRILKAKKASTRMFSSLYSAWITFVGYRILNKTDFLPPMLMGSGSIENLYKEFPIVANPNYA